MYIRGKGVEYATIRAIVERVSAERYGGNVRIHRDAGPISRITVETTERGGGEMWMNGYGFKGRIDVHSSKVIGARRSASGRRINAACWHAFRDCIRAILTQYPHAIVSTGMARYEGLAGFERVYPETANANIGSLFAPRFMPDLCECEDSE